MSTSLTYQVGSRIEYRPFTGERRRGTVLAKYTDVKNGYPGFDLVDDDGQEWWGYDDQITQVL